MAKRANGVATFAASGSMMSWTFGPEQRVAYDVRANFPDFTALDDCQQRIILNGVKQRLADCIAGVKTPQERFERMQAVADGMKQGRYETRAAAVSNDAMLAAAITAVKGIALEKVVAYLSGKTPAERLALSQKDVYKQAYLTQIAIRTQAINMEALDDEIAALDDE